LTTGRKGIVILGHPEQPRCGLIRCYTNSIAIKCYGSKRAESPKDFVVG
jgi:hypothetical protein